MPFNYASDAWPVFIGRGLTFVTVSRRARLNVDARDKPRRDGASATPAFRLAKARRRGYGRAMPSATQGFRRPQLLRWSLGLAFLALAATLLALGFDPRKLVAEIAERRAFAAEHFALAAALYVLAYVGFAALALPGAWMVSFAGGALFGVGLGLPLALAGSDLGACAAMLAARYLLRDAVRRRFPEFVAKADASIARDGAFWVVAARLTPVMPFFAVNVAAGLTRLPAAQFALASLAGSAPLAAIYVIAGARLESLASPGDLIGPWSFAALLALGAGALAAPALLRRR